MKVNRPPLAVEIQLEAANRLGIRARIVDPDYGYLFELEKDGRKRLMLGGRSPLNDAVAARLAEDKFYAGMLLAEAGYRSPESVRCLSPYHFENTEYNERAGRGPGLEFAASRGYPLVVKPNRLSHGRGVRVVRSRDELIDAVEAVWKLDSVALVQVLVEGTDLRLDFLDLPEGDAFLLGYRRSPLLLEGDGKRTLRELLVAVDPRADGAEFWSTAQESSAWQREVAALGRDGDSVLASGARVLLGSEVLNLHRLATATLIEDLSPSWRRHGLGIGRSLGLRHFGIDLKAPDDEDPATSTVIEVNASPLLSQIYRMGHKEIALRCQMRVLAGCFS
ncbi:MAG: hypothetical protein ACE5F1_07680 [Planctomycetota bacterium]